MTGALGWTVRVDGEQASVLDPAGTLRATVAGRDPATRKYLELRVRQDLPDGWAGVVTLADGRTFDIDNGDRGGVVMDLLGGLG